MAKNPNPANPNAPVKGNELERHDIARSAAEGYLDERGREMPSPLPIAPPVGYKKSPSIAEQIRAMVISEKLKEEARAAGKETFEEADDFDVDDDFDPSSPYEANFDIPASQLRDLQPIRPLDPAVPPGQPPAAKPPAEGEG